MSITLTIGQFSESFYPIVDGVGRVAVNYAATLGKMGHHSYAISPMNEGSYVGNFPFELIDYISYSVPGAKQYKTGIANLDTHYHAKVDKVSFDIVHAHTPFFCGLEAVRVSVRNNCPLVGTFHSKYYDDFYKATGLGAVASLGVKFVVDFYEKCDEVWAVSKNSADVLHDYGYKGEVFLMDNGTELRTPDSKDLRAACDQYGLDTTTPVLLFVGQMDFKKNILRILEACSLLKNQGNQFLLVFAGQGRDRDAIEEKASEFGLGDLTHFTGHITDTALLDGLYQRASLFVFPSLYDNAPMVLREAAAMGTPAVVIKGSSSAEVVRDRENGFLSEDTPEELSRVITEALADPSVLTAVGQKARETIPIGWDIILQNVVGRYENLISQYKNESVKKTLLGLRKKMLEKPKK